MVATWDRDRSGDQIVRGAFAKSIAEWQSIGRVVPLHDNHDAAAIVGEVDPASMVETENGLEVAGRVDLDTERGRALWRALKKNRLGFSFGYLATKIRERGDVRELVEVDLYEVSLTPSPLNNHTRLVSTKAEPRARRILDQETGESRSSAAEVAAKAQCSASTCGQ